MSFIRALRFTSPCQTAEHQHIPSVTCLCLHIYLKKKKKSFLNASTAFPLAITALKSHPQLSSYPHSASQFSNLILSDVGPWQSARAVFSLVLSAQFQCPPALNRSFQLDVRPLLPDGSPWSHQGIFVFKCWRYNASVWAKSGWFLSHIWECMLFHPHDWVSVVC